MLLSKICRRFLGRFPISTNSEKYFKILYDSHVDYCRIDFKELDVTTFFESEVHHFIRYDWESYPSFLILNGERILSKDSRKLLTHNQIYAEIFLKGYMVEYINHCDAFISYYKLDKVVLFKYNQYLRVGIPFEIIVPKT